MSTIRPGADGITKMQKSIPKTTKTTERTTKKAKLSGALNPDRIKSSPRPEPNPKESAPNPKRKRKAAPEPTVLPRSFKIIAGSYEKILYGLSGTISPQPNLEPVFIFPAHVSQIKTLSASPRGGKWLATGSTDEIIKVWDLRRQKEIGGLLHHTGSITHLSFVSPSHLISASEDGSLALFRSRDWVVLRALKGHKGPVYDVGVHPSGKVALSVGKDRTLRMWDLMRGRGAASTKLGGCGEGVRWSVDGSRFAVRMEREVIVFKTDMTKEHVLARPKRVHDMKFCLQGQHRRELLLLAGEEGKVFVFSLQKDSSAPVLFAELIGHENRVKALDVIEIALPSPSPHPSTTLVCTVSSDGRIRLFNLDSLPESTPEEGVVLPIQTIAEYDSKGTRFTCVTFAEGDDVARTLGKRKLGEDDEEGEGEKYEVLEGEGSADEEISSADEDGVQED